MIIVALVVIWWLTGLTGLIFGESTFLLVQVDHLRFFGEEEGSITRSKQEFNQMIDTKPCPSKNGKGISSSSDLKMVESGKDTFFATELVNFGQGWKPIVNLAVPQRTRNSNKMTTLQIIPFAISVGPTFRPSSWLFLPLFFSKAHLFHEINDAPQIHQGIGTGILLFDQGCHRFITSAGCNLPKTIFCPCLLEYWWIRGEHFPAMLKNKKNKKPRGFGFEELNRITPLVYGHPVGWKMTKMNSLPFTHLPFNIFASTKILTSPLQKKTPQNNHLTFQSKFLELLEPTETISEGPTPRGCSPANVPKAPRTVLQPQRVTHRKRWKCDFVPTEGRLQNAGRLWGWGTWKVFVSGKISYLSISQNPAFFSQNWATVRSKETYLKKQQCPHNAIVESAKDM